MGADTWGNTHQDPDDFRKYRRASMIISLIALAIMALAIFAAMVFWR